MIACRSLSQGLAKLEVDGVKRWRLPHRREMKLVNAVLSRFAIRTGLSVALFSRVLFGNVGAGLATLIFCATAIYYAVFEGSVIAVGVLIPVTRLDHWLAAQWQTWFASNPGLLITGGIAALGMLAASLGGIYHAWSLVAEEKLAAQGTGSCKMFMGFPEWIPLDTWLPQVFQPEGLCGEVVWTLLGQSMAVWSLALFVFCLLVLAAKLAFGRRTA